MSKCKICRAEFTKRSMTHKTCSVECAQELVQREKVAKQRKESRIQREKLKSRSEWLKEAQTWVNRYIRLRDANEPCISCGRDHKGQYHAGHYLSTGARPELRFTEANIHKQCSVCNNHLSGNLVLYRKALIEKIGLEQVEWLEGPHEPKKHTIDDLKEIIKLYKLKCKEVA